MVNYVTMEQYHSAVLNGLKYNYWITNSKFLLTMIYLGNKGGISFASEYKFLNILKFFKFWDQSKYTFESG